MANERALAKPRDPAGGRVTFRQEGGNDGYQYAVRVDGRLKVNGLTRREALAIAIGSPPKFVPARFIANRR